MPGPNSAWLQVMKHLMTASEKITHETVELHAQIPNLQDHHVTSHGLQFCQS